MSLHILDTDILSLFQRRHQMVVQHVLQQTPSDIAISMITVQEQTDGWRGLLSRAKSRQETARAYLFFVDILLPVLRQFQVLAFPDAAILRYEQLVAQKLNIGRMDLRIGATALEFAATVVTRNLRDFGRITGLRVVDWSV